MDTGLNDRLAVVTGAANGIGAATARQLAQEGARLALLDRDREPLERLAAELNRNGRAPSITVIDLTSHEEVQQAFAVIAAQQGPVEILVNNVGQAPRDRATEFSVADPALWRFIVDVSLMTALSCSQQVVPAMRRARRGKIVNLASEAAFTGGVRSPEYAAAKAGVIGFTRSLARQLAPDGVNVNAVAPGATMTAAMGSFPEDQLEAIRGAIPMGRLGLPEEIADAICFLASERANFITGQTLLVNGGRNFN